MFILQIMKHTPESCPLGNSKNLDIMIQWLENIETIAAKYNIKLLNIWTDRTEHASYAIFDTPNMSSFTQFEIDPQNIPLITFNHIEKKVVSQAKDTLTFFKEYKKQKH